MKQQFRRKDDDRYMSPRFEVDSTIIPTLGEIVFHQLYDETGWKVTDITKRYWSDRGGETTLCLEIEIEEIKEVILSHSKKLSLFDRCRKWMVGESSVNSLKRS